MIDVNGGFVNQPQKWREAAAGSPWALPILLGVSAVLVFIFPERVGAWANEM